jgi:hypothetical protein
LKNKDGGVGRKKKAQGFVFIANVKECEPQTLFYCQRTILSILKGRKACYIAALFLI